MSNLSKTSILACFLILLVSSSCKKYEDGPWFSIYSKMERATGNWRFSLVMDGGTDKTEEHAQQMVNMSRNGYLQWVQGYSGSVWNTYGPEGRWEFIDDKNQIRMHFDRGVATEFTLIWDITRLAYGDLRLRRFEGERKIEWHLWKY